MNCNQNQSADSCIKAYDLGSSMEKFFWTDGILPLQDQWPERPADTHA